MFHRSRVLGLDNHDRTHQSLPGRESNNHLHKYKCDGMHQYTHDGLNQTNRLDALNYRDALSMQNRQDLAQQPCESRLMQDYFNEGRRQSVHGRRRRRETADLR
jgi:hypothetical protein